MAWLYSKDVVQQLSENVLLYDLAQMRGTNALLSRIPKNTGGIYAWYRRFELDPDAKYDSAIFVKSILNELYKPHSAPRETRLPPSNRIILKSETSFQKESALKNLAENPSFRELILMLLENSILFQQPLYIGQATNLYSRIRSHLYENSILRERLNIAGHNIERSRLLVITTTESELNCNASNADEDELESEFSESEPEKLVEDILSRLFLPSFTLRYG
ncbi:GIY-YIG nuclease family protein [Nostoc sp.]|uniref:GIY-YIG nuclease family protein n=1 Tax=Nostoc sp. TaxID=1180 RepID=UPI002FF8C0F3